MIIKEIVSLQNQRVKTWMHLLDRKGRQKHGQFLIEGTHLVEEAIHAGAPLRTIVIDQDKELPRSLYEASKQHVEWIRVPRQILEKCTDTDTPQGIFAVLDKLEPSTDRLFAADALVIAVDGVQDPGNLGTIIRSADAVGASGVFLGNGTVDLYNPKTIRSTMGSLFHLPVLMGDLREWLPRAREHDAQIIGTDLSATKSCYEIDYCRPTWIILGNEGQGMSTEIARQVTEPVIIPMQGQAESLNVAMAATVLLFEASRQRIFKRSQA